MKFRQLLTLLPALLLLLACNQASAGGGCGGSYCHSAPYAQPAYCQPQYACSYVEKTIYVPQVVTEQRQVTVTEYQRDMEERTVYVPQVTTEQREITVTVMRPEVRERTISVPRCVPEVQQRTQQYTVLVPYQEQVEATRRVCRQVPVEQTYHVTVDRGSYQTFVQKVPVRVPAPQACAPSAGCGYASGGCGYGGGCGYASAGCGGCGYASSGCGGGGCGGYASAGCGYGGGYGGCGYTTAYVDRTYSRWVPNCVQEERRVMVLKPTYEDVPYTYTVTRCRPEVRERTFNVTIYRTVTEQRNVQYTVAVPTQVNKTVPVQVCHTVPRQIQVPVMRPVQVQRTVPVQVCHYVPRTIQVKTCAPVHSGSYGGGCGGGCYSGGSYGGGCCY